jgi:ABC-type phosphate/phosphonate transport system substrate-binding protein
VIYPGNDTHRHPACVGDALHIFRVKLSLECLAVGGCSKAQRSTPATTKRHGGAGIGPISLLLAVILALPFAAAPPPSPSPPPKRRLQNASKTNYTIGIPFDPLLTPEESLVGGINPFVIFLNEHVGKQFEPRIYFKLEMLYFDRTTLESGLQAGTIDFFFASAVETLCVEERYKTSTIAQISRYDSTSVLYNQLQQFDGAELTGYGGLFVVRSDSDIETVEDFKGKVMVSEPGLGSAGDGLGGCLLQLGVLQERGLSYTDDAVSVIWNGGGAGMTISLLLDGLADVGFLRTGILQLILYLQQVLPEGHPIRKFADRVKPDTFRVVEGRMDRKWDGGWNGKFQRETSTPVAPEWSVNALQSVDTNVKQAFVEAIMDLRGFTDNTSTVEQPWLNPALAGAGYVYRFRSPLPLTDVRNLMESLGMFRVDPVTHDRGCKISDMSFRGVYDAISCPAGSFKRTLQQVMTGCRDEGFSCPALVGILGCTCHPCKQGDEFDVKMTTHGTDPESLVVAVENEESGDVKSNHTIKICRKKMEPCIDSDSGQLIEVLVSDNSFSEKGLVIEWVLRYSETRNDTGSLIRLHPGGFLYAVNITAQVPGEHIFKLLVNGQEIPNSPFTINVLPIKCDLREYFDWVEGKCACLPNHLRVAVLNGECRHIVGFTVALVAMGMTAIFFMTIIYMIRFAIRILITPTSRVFLQDIALHAILVDFLNYPYLIALPRPLAIRNCWLASRMFLRSAPLTTGGSARLTASG